MHNGIDLDQDFYIKDGEVIKNFQATSRIGSRVGMDKLWRFVVDNVYGRVTHAENFND